MEDIGSDMIIGFSCSFSRALLKKLKQLKDEGRIFVDGYQDALEQEEGGDPQYSQLTTIAEMVISHLVRQIRFPMTEWGETSMDKMFPQTTYPKATPSDIEELISTTEEFLTACDGKISI